ncbi:MipA/OmpV family protein [Sphingopyxis flava]|uniref:Outer membrane scaffolding protein for murein synthesis, MipA/OmpV family n=1 Tax=Sphingopyxis flava TaxID=1507287 RepID=A0A1T5EYS5_9SPHN|nr:MipA/OmpV family protein [Sphingopyxis flava]SKB89092.1 Outer membrane scaffolding protein for murein synthesis, MipA/OmpV family [Sphingopyxis flava]
MDTPVSHADRRPAPALLTAILCAAALAAAATAHARDSGPDTDLSVPDAAGAAPALVPVIPAPASHFQDSEVDQDILLPPARPQDDDPDRKWSRDYLALAAGVVTVPSYLGSDQRAVIPGFYLRGRLSGFSFSTRGTNLQVDLIRQRRGQRVDWKLGPIINLRSDRTGRIKDPQVEALGERKLAVEAGISAGVTYSGLITSKYDQIGFRVVALKDISGRHGSWLASPTIEYGTPISKRAYVGLSASVNVYGKGFGDYYFDIDQAGSDVSGLPVYDGAGRKATAGKYTIGAAGAYSLSGDLRKGFVLIGGVQYGRVASRYAASPIVRIAGDADQWIGGAGIAYQF